MLGESGIRGMASPNTVGCASRSIKAMIILSSSRPATPLTEPCVILSNHTAPLFQSLTTEDLT